jgi:Tfp pilus assembly protein PilX
MTRGRDMKVFKNTRIKKNEKGFALILALVIMAAMTLIGMSVVMNMTIDVQLSSNEREGKLALLGAEAGVQETLSRLHLPGSNARYVGEAPTTVDPRDTSWTASFDSTAVNESGLNYSVSIKYLLEDNTEGYCDDNNVNPNTSGNSNVPPATCDQTTPEAVMFGQDFNIDPTVTKVSWGTFPVYEVTSTGTSPQNTQRTIIAYIGASGLNTDTDDAINTNGCVSNNGGVAVDTICFTTGCANEECDATKAATTDMNTHLGDNLSNIEGQADLKITCSATAECIALIDATTDEDWGDWTGDTYSVIVYADNTVELGITGADLGPDNGGRGILIVEGDLRLSGGFQWDGLIYVLGNLTLDGGGAGVNVTGGILANTTTTLNGASLVVNYDLPTLRAVARENSTAAMLVWKRL